jgi:DNA polymerase gamma 1
MKGKKSDGTDVHSKTAQFAGISRDQAKILNYGRIFGAGRHFAQVLLLQFNKGISVEEARQKAANIYAQTKGVKGYKLTEAGEEFLRRHGDGVDVAPKPSGVYSLRDVKELFLLSRGVDDEDFDFKVGLPFRLQYNSE